MRTTAKLPRTEFETQSTFSAVEQFIDETAQETEHVVKHYRTAFQRYPLSFGLLVIFGTVSTVFGFEHILEATPFFAEHPVFTLFVGIGVLSVTGTLYKRLS